MPGSQPQERKEAFFISRSEAAAAGPVTVSGDELYFKLTGKETNGVYMLMECHTPPGGGPPLHVHHNEDESFYVIEGDFVFEVGGKRSELHTGDFAFGPRGVPHRFRNVGAAPGRMILTAEPAGVETFFREVSAVAGPPDPAVMTRIAGKYNIEILGPPLGPD